MRQVFPVTFVTSGLVNRTFGAAAARRLVYVGFAVGCPLSLLTASPRVAAASATSYLISQLLETHLFDVLARRGRSDPPWWLPQLTSSVAASAVDSALFSLLALSGTGLPWVTLGIGDFAVKASCAALALVPFRAAMSALPAAKRTQ